MSCFARRLGNPFVINVYATIKHNNKQKMVISLFFHSRSTVHSSFLKDHEDSYRRQTELKWIVEISGFFFCNMAFILQISQTVRN